jgi:hypothetical protein
MSMIPLSGTDILEFTPTELREGFDPVPTFRIRIPTFAMRDKMAAILFQRGFTPATISQSRGILINALYELYDEPTADDHATFLESYWTRNEVHEELMTGWQIREAQRLFDIAHGVPREKLPQEPMPPAPYTMREQARQASIITTVLDKSEEYKTYQSRFMVQEEEENEMILRLFIAGWSGLIDRSGETETEVKPVRDEMDRLTLDSIERARQWLADRGAQNAWAEVLRQVRSQFGAPAVLEKNFDSPLDTNSSLTGLQTSSGALETKGGSSTTSSITPTRASKSKGISGASRNSRSDKSGMKAKRGRTAAAS